MTIEFEIMDIGLLGIEARRRLISQERYVREILKSEIGIMGLLWHLPDAIPLMEVEGGWIRKRCKIQDIYEE